MDRFTRRFRW